MGIRVTGISTPIGGISWEYSKEEKNLKSLMVSPTQKIKVFISSICGVEKYDKVRADLKNAIESTELADVYTFEGEDASSLPVDVHYKFALQDSDLCIFLIDNADGITSGVQAEIDTVKKYNIKALYYFCDEKKKDKTPLERSLMGASFSKCKTVHSFNELSQEGAHALINDIITVYHNYCIGRMLIKPEENGNVQTVEISETGKYQLPTIPEVVLKDVDKCKHYLEKFILGYCEAENDDKIEKSSVFDEWGLQFLKILFEEKSIKNFNTAMYLEDLKDQQDAIYNQIVRIRWQAIQEYFLGNVDRCLSYLESALQMAKRTSQPKWIINDILIDMRNQEMTNCTIKNSFQESDAQIELDNSKERVYYPILDRIHESLYEKYIKGLYKEKIKSPNVITFGSNIDQCCAMLASTLIVSMYNGSLTHILCFYDEIKNFVFYLCCKYDDWNIRLNLYKLVIFSESDKEITGIQESYPQILANISSSEAKSIMDFCSNHTIEYERINSQLRAFGAIGYFLDDKCFDYYEKIIVNIIHSWLNDDNSIVFIGQNIFKCLSKVAYRMSQDTLSEICCQFIDRHYTRYYYEMFKFIANYIDLRKMSDNSSVALLSHINSVLDNEKDREQIKYSSDFLYVLRNQNKEITSTLDAKVALYFPDFYNGNYKLETTENKKQDIPTFIQKYIEKIIRDNETQGKNGMYSEYGTRAIATVRAILLNNNDIIYSPEIMNKLIFTVADTLLVSKEGISIKLDAISLLISIVLKFPEDYKRNQSVYEKLYQQQELIECADSSIIFSNLDDISLKIGLQFLFASIGKDVYETVLELMPCIGDNDANVIAVSSLIVKYLETSNSVILPSKIEAIVLQNALHWTHSENLQIRWNAVHILLMLTRNTENDGVINHQLIKLIDSDCVYIKNLIMRNLYKTVGITNETKEYIVSKCKHDTNFVVRMVCNKVEKKNIESV